MNTFVTVGGLCYNFVIIIICTIIILAKRKKSATHVEEDFLSGGRNSGVLAIAASMALGVLGGGHINGVPVQTWADGVATVFYCLGTGCFFLFVMRYTGIWYRRIGCATVNDMFARMFHPLFGPVLSGLAVGYSWLVLTVETQSMGVVIGNMTGLAMLPSCLIGALLGVLYVCLAGQEEVAYVNVVNAILMYIFGIIVLIFIGFRTAGGWTAINDTVLSNHPEFVACLGNPTILKTYTIGTFLAAALGMNFLQGNIQPCASAKDVKVLHRACTWAIPMNVFFGLIIILMAFAGMGLAEAGQLDVGGVVDPNALNAGLGANSVVQLVLVYMPSWLQICVIGMFLAAMLSTFAMLALSISMVINRNIIPYFPNGDKMSRKTENWLGRLWIVLFAAIAAFFGVSVQGQANLALSWGWGWFIPLFIMFFIGMKWKRSRVGSLIVVFACWIVNCVLTFTPLAANLGLEGNNYSIFMFVLSLVLGFIITALDKNALPPYRKVYGVQRAAFEAKRAQLKKEV